MKKLYRWPILWWLRFWAKLAFSRINPFIIGVTGSAGKSSAISAIATVARLKFRRVKIAQEANSESGIPADMLGLHFTDYSLFDWLRICFFAPLHALPLAFSLHPSALSFDCYIVEMGIDEPTPPKNMEYLLTILKPHIGVVLNALPVHTEQFERSDLVIQGRTLIESIAVEKGKLVTQNPNLQFAILNADQLEITSLKPRNKAKLMTFGKSKNSNIVIQSIKPSLEGTSIAFHIQRSDLGNSRSDLIRFPNLALPEFYGHTIAAALAVASALQIDSREACAVILKAFTLPPGRGRMFCGIKNTTIIDSSYNASSVTMIESLKLLKTISDEQKTINNKQKAISKKRQTLAVLGDMRELGNQAKMEHELVAKELLKSADSTILVGPLMKQYVLPLLETAHHSVQWFQTAGEASRYLLEVYETSSKKISWLKGGENVLVKGSQNTIFLEIVVEALLKNKSDVAQLCRRGAFWDKQRSAYI